MKTYAVIPVENEGDSMPLVNQLDVPSYEIPNDGPLNLSAKWNQGLDWAQKLAQNDGAKEWNVAILNDDLILGRNCIGYLSHGLRAKSHHGAAYIGRGLVQPHEYGYAENADYAGQTLTGWCFTMRGETGFRFDEQFRWWYGDSDFEKQLRAQGQVAVAVGAASAIHLRPTESSRRPELAAIAREDEARFAIKWQLDPASLFLAKNPDFGR